jgi:hypothetical protein
LKISELQLSIGNACSIDLRMVDFNRLRWTFYALQANAELRHILRASESQSISVYDSLYLIHHNVNPAVGSCVVLWDGFNSYLELLRAFPVLSGRHDLTFAYVGAFVEIAAALPPRSLKLFPDSGSFSKQELAAPFRFKSALKLKTSLRGFKNYAGARARHRQLSDGGNLVFCGLVRPTKQVVANMLTNANLHSLQDSFEKLGECHWQKSSEDIHALVREMYLRCQELDCSNAEDYSGIYATLNVCSRLFIVNALHAHGSKLFINEYGYQSNFDPYDVYVYRNNTYLDFGSSRGACHWYPRTMDMQATGKHFVALRMIQEQQSLRTHLDTHSEDDFIDQLNTHVALAVQTAALSGHLV